ncbi:hypothetical protein VE04_03542 [Pseudogymnoascus sp. 24MN13]|nr:hypothetical protein VE04_03542 [Pseudogymnoascus sp. 24MN13]
MKSFAIAALITSLAGAILATLVPTEQARQAHGIFGSGDNLINNEFDSAACIVSSVIGGSNPRCQGKGEAITQDGVHYTYTYDTNDDGTLKVTITLKEGGTCTYNLRADGNYLQTVIKDAAKRCIKEK